MSIQKRKAILQAEIFQNVLRLAEELNIGTSYAGRTLRMVNLAPDIQEAAIESAEFDSLTINKLKGNIPDDWRGRGKCSLVDVNVEN